MVSLSESSSAFRGNRMTCSARLDAWRGGVICAMLICVPVTYSFHFVSFLHVKEAAFCVGLSAISLILLLRGGFFWQGCSAFAPLWVFLLIAGYRLVPFPVHVPPDAVVGLVCWALALVSVALAFDLLNREVWRNRFTDAFLISAVIVAVLGLIQYVTWAPFLFPRFPGYTQRVYSVFGNQDLYGGYIALAVPIFIHRFLTDAHQGRWDFPALVLIVPALLISGCRSAWLAAAAGTAVVIAFRRLPVKRLAVLSGAVLVPMAFTVWLAPEPTIDRLASTWRPRDEGREARIRLWHAAWDMFLDAPVLGVGPGNYAYWSPRYLGSLLETSAPGTAFAVERHADHPHSDPLKILSETGIVGLLGWAWMVRRMASCKGPEWGLLTTWVVYAVFNCPSQSIAHGFAGLLFAGMLLARHRASAPARKSRSAAWVQPLGTLAASAFLVWAVVLPSYSLRAAEDAQLAGRPALPLYESVVRHAWPNAAAHRDYGIALADAGRYDEADRELQRALDGLDTGDIYLALAVAASKRGDKQSAYRWAVECTRRWPLNPEARQLIDLERMKDKRLRQNKCIK